jgi:hypothetical protein
VSSAFSAERKLELVREKFTSREDVYALRTKKGYIPIREPLTDRVLIEHMNGRHMIGAYTPLLNATAPWLAFDFDSKPDGGLTAREDSSYLVKLLRECGIDPIVNTSQSNKGIHVRIIFDAPIEAWIVRRFARAFLEEAALEDSDSFDRFFPAQDVLATHDKALGNQIALPLHHQRATTTGGTVLLDHEYLPIPLGDATWDYLDLHEPATRENLMNALEDIDQVMVVEEAPDYSGGNGHRRGGNYRGRREDGSEDFGPVGTMLEECELFMRACSDRLDYFSWVAVCSNLTQFDDQDGRGLFHRISATDARYDSKDTNDKYDNVLTTMGFVTCARLAQEGWRCPELGEDGICDKHRRPNGYGPKAPCLINRYK